MKPTTKLSVEERVRAIVHAKRQEDPAAKISVSELCRLAGVNRSGLYAHHRSLLDELLPKNVAPTSTKEGAMASERVDQTKDIKAANKALLYVCLELQMEIRSLRAKLPRRSTGKSGRE